MAVSDYDLGQLVDKVIENIKTEQAGGPKTPPGAATPPAPQPYEPQKKSAPVVPGPQAKKFSVDSGGGVFTEMDQAAKAARKAFEEYSLLSLRERKKYIDAIRDIGELNAEKMARMVYDETGMGRYPHKITKHILAARETPGVEDLEPHAWSGDHGLTIEEPAPYGVLGVITPSTHPSETVLNNAIMILSAGNTLVINGHPGAKASTAKMVQLINQAVITAGGPPNLVTCINKPTIESAQELMKHPNVRVLLVTGGGGVVKAAMNSGKKAITAGPGNPPVVVDETADLEKAARSIIEGGGFDNNILCIAEKQVFAVKSIANQLKEEFLKKGCVELNPWQTNEVLKHALIENKGDYKESPVSRDFIGRDANVLLETIGIRPGHDTPMIIAEVPYEHTLVWTEQMMPIMPIVKVPDVDTAIDMAFKTEHGFGHTAMMHSRNIEKLSKMARLINTTIFVKNGASLAGLGAGGEGFASYSIASPTGEGITRPRTFTRVRRCTLVDHFRIV